MSCDKAARTNRVAVWQVDSGGFKEPCVRWGPEFPRKRGNMGTSHGPLRIIKISVTRWMEAEMRPFVSVCLCAKMQ